MLNSVCISTVCGEKMFDKYIHTLDESDKRKIQLTRSQRTFVFGGDMTKSDVVQSDIPLFPSGSAMKSDCVNIDIEKKIQPPYLREKIHRQVSVMFQSKEQ